MLAAKVSGGMEQGMIFWLAGALDRAARHNIGIFSPEVPPPFVDGAAVHATQCAHTFVWSSCKISIVSQWQSQEQPHGPQL